jgi:nucleoside-diphosphate-sugar epimerase
MLSDRKILITGATGQVARPVADALARDNEVWCIARFSDPRARAALEAQGMKTRVWHLGSEDFAGLPDDFTHVIHSGAHIYGSDFDEAITANAEGTGLLMTHCRRAEAFLFVSSCAVYRENADPLHPYVETDPLGGYAFYAPTYAVGKIATEGVVRMAARQLGLRSTIARLNVAYGVAGHGGLPVQHFATMQQGRPIPIRRDRPNYCSPIHEDDIVAQVGPLLAAASVPATIVNWGGDEPVTEIGFCEYLAGIAGLEARFEESDQSFNSFITENSRRRALAGPCRVHWRDGVRRCIEARFPDVKLRPDPKD